MPSPTVETTSASISAFDRYQTYSFEVAKEAPGDYAVTDRVVDVQHRAMALVANELAHKGYVNVPDHGDLRVVIAGGEGNVSETKTRSRTSTVIMGDRVETVNVPAGALVVDVYDTKRGERVWQVIAGGEVKSSGTVDDARLTSTISKMMESFPARHGHGGD
jgi:acylphosphatase